jgi:hypothetical protein
MKYVVMSLMFLMVGCQSETVTLIPGPQGVPGVAGANGHSLVSETVEASGCECDWQGGTRLDIYMDMDDSLSLTEGDTFQSSLVACNGMNGLNGQDGLPGATGAQGIPGATGPEGIAGPAGEVGPEGAQGLVGPVGPMGPAGPQGLTGAQGPAGSGATLQAFTLGSSCLSVGGGLYAKKSGDTAKIYDDNDCDSNDFVTTVGEQASYWLSSTRLAFVDASSGVVLRVLNFN